MAPVIVVAIGNFTVRREGRGSITQPRRRYQPPPQAVGAMSGLAILFWACLFNREFMFDSVSGRYYTVRKSVYQQTHRAGFF